MYKNNKGITLVALVITIIVLLILAGVSISLVVGDNGVLTQSTSAAKKTDTASASQALQLSLTTLTSDFLGGPWVKDFNARLYDLTQKDLDDILQKNGYYIVGYTALVKNSVVNNNVLTLPTSRIASGNISGYNSSAILAEDDTSDTTDYEYYSWVTISQGTDVKTDAVRKNTAGNTTYTALIKWSQKSVEIISTFPIQPDTTTVTIP